jgi:hypothetical protein
MATHVPPAHEHHEIEKPISGIFTIATPILAAVLSLLLAVVVVLTAK